MSFRRGLSFSVDLLRGPGALRLLPLAIATLAFGLMLGEARAQPAAAAQDPGKDAPPASTVADLKALERMTRTTLKKVMPSVVGVSGGSGVIVSADGYVLTVAHVGGRAGRRVSITLPDGRRVRGRTLGNDRGVDAGLVKIEGEGPWPHAEMGRSADLKAGQWCIALGYPVSFDRTKDAAVRIGRILHNRDTMVITDCTIMGGDSGGPLFDLDGRVIAISSRCDNRLTMNIHVPIDRFRDQWERLKNGEDFNSQAANVAYLGIAPDDHSDGSTIGKVFPGTGAAKAGLKAGDVIVTFDGKTVQEYDDLPPLIMKHKPGDDVSIEVRRGDKTLKLKATLGKRPD